MSDDEEMHVREACLRAIGPVIKLAVIPSILYINIINAEWMEQLISVLELITHHLLDELKPPSSSFRLDDRHVPVHASRLSRREPSPGAGLSL